MSMSQVPVAPDRLLWEEIIPGGAHWSYALKRGTTLRLIDVEGGANAHLVMYNQDDKLERYNTPDTLKAQHTAHLTRGFVCYSDMGRVMCSITQDSVGWHDPMGAISTAQTVKRKYGEARYQQHRNAMHRNAQDNILIELGKWGLGKRDLISGINFFSKVRVDEKGSLQFIADHSPEGSYVDLRFEMNVLVVISATQHPLDSNAQYSPKPIQAIAWRSDPPNEDDFCRNFRAENRRGFYNTEILFR